MRQLFLSSALVFAVLTSASATAQRGTSAPKPEQYSCVTEHSAGMTFSTQTKSWRPTTFRPDQKYVVSRSPGEGEGFQVTKLGQAFPDYRCTQPFNEFGYLECRGLGEFSFNRKNGRFPATYTIAYVNAGLGPEVTDANGGDPSIKIGKCSPF